MAENHVEIDGDECFEEDETSEREETLLYFGGLLRKEEEDRLQFIANFSRSVKAWIAKPDDISAQSMLRAHLPTALCLSINAPFRDVREKFSELLKEIQVLFELPCSNAAVCASVQNGSSPISQKARLNSAAHGGWARGTLSHATSHNPCQVSTMENYTKEFLVMKLKKFLWFKVMTGT